MPNPACPVHLACGACRLMPLDAEVQLSQKAREFGERWRAAGLPELGVPWRLRRAGAPLAYRNRVRLQVTRDAQVRFFNPNKAEDCPVLEPSLLEGIALARRLVARHAQSFANFSHLEVRARDARGQGAIVFGERETAQSAAVDLPDTTPDWLLGVRGHEPLACQRWQLTPTAYVDVPLDAFMQVNAAVNRALVEHVVSGLIERGAQSFLDLYMGAGNFALPLLAAGLCGRGVDTHRGAVRAAERAALEQGFRFDQARGGDTAEVCAHWLADGVLADAVICDPPRAGMRQAVHQAARLTRGTLVMVSCHPQSLYRDVTELTALGFRCASGTLFEMFPQTSHLEAVVWLERPPPRPGS